MSVERAGIIRRTHVWRIEQGLSAPRYPTVKELCLFYGADEETTAALVELAKATGSGWYERHGDAVPQKLGIYLGAEIAASTIDTYDPEVIHGVLQTEGYARALFEGERPEDDPVTIETLLEARRERQKMFFAGRPEGARLRVVLNEAALAREVGGRATMRRQLDHLSELDGHGGVETLVLPWNAGAHRAIYGGYAIFRFPDSQPTVTYVENYAGGTFLERKEEVDRMQSVHAGVLRQSITLKEYRDG